MNIRKFTIKATATIAMVAALSFPYIVQAVSIGEIVLQSRLGEPLLAKIDLMVGSSERIENSCLSLAAPGPNEEDPSGYLTKADLTLKIEGGRQYVVISSRKPFNDAFARLLLQVKCPGMGSVTKTLTILPDLDTSVLQAPIAAISVPAEAGDISAPSPSEAQGIAPAADQLDTTNTQPDVEKHLSAKAARPVNKPHARTASKKSPPASFRLKLSGDPTDESRIGKHSAKERALRLAQQKAIDADEQMARFLTLQHQVKQLQDELGEIKLRLAQLSASSSVSATSAPSPLAPPLATDTQEKLPTPAIAVNQPVVQQADPYLQKLLIVSLGLGLSILALWLGLRYRAKIKSRSGVKSQQGAEPTLKPADDIATLSKMAPSPVVIQASQVPISQAQNSQVKSALAPVIVAPPKASTAMNEAVSHPFLIHEIEKEVTEEDSMLEEAELYAAYGRRIKAVEILQEIIARCPSKAEAWPLLLSIYSSLGKAEEFEKTAREFLKYHKDSPLWQGIQALGRTFEQNNPLYAGNNNCISAAPLSLDKASTRRSIGDVLVESGILSKQDLQNCLNDFDPKEHGRFGGYLVARKAITVMQLNQALLQQQGVNAEAKPGTLPSLQEVENFMADFDPKRDGSVGEFLESRNAVTPEQLSRLLHQQSSHRATAETTQADEPPPLHKEFAPDFVLEPSKGNVLDLEFEPATGKDASLDFEVEPSHLSFPEIMGNSDANKKPIDR